MSRPASSGRPREGPRHRRLLSFFFLLHWGAVAVYLLPMDRASVELLPGPASDAAYWIVPRAVRAAWPVAEPYLDMTATRQHWTLFAPWPADWENSLRVVPYFPVQGTDTLWRADTVFVRGATERPYPHVLDHRTFRILYNIGYDSWGRWYRPYFARELCRTLRTEKGVAPDGVELVNAWRRLDPPWVERAPAETLQWMGGFTCGEDARSERGPGWEAYGLPAGLDVSGWPTVGPRDTTQAPERRPDGVGGAS